MQSSRHHAPAHGRQRAVGESAWQRLARRRAAAVLAGRLREFAVVSEFRHRSILRHSFGRRFDDAPIAFPILNSNFFYLS